MALCEQHDAGSRTVDCHDGRADDGYRAMQHRFESTSRGCLLIGMLLVTLPRRYTAWVGWNGTSLQPRWDIINATELYPHTVSRGPASCPHSQLHRPITCVFNDPFPAIKTQPPTPEAPVLFPTTLCACIERSPCCLLAALRPCRPPPGLPSLAPVPPPSKRWSRAARPTRASTPGRTPTWSLRTARCVARDSRSGHQLLLPPADWCPIFEVWTTQVAAALHAQLMKHFNRFAMPYQNVS